MRWLIVGPYPPEQGEGAGAAAAFVAERLDAGDTVHAVSPRPTAAHEHFALDGLGGVRALQRVARTERCDGLWLRVESGIVLRHDVDRSRGLVERRVLALWFRRFDQTILDVGDVSLLPGGRAGRPVLHAATRFVVRKPEDADALIASGAAPARIARLAVDTPDGWVAAAADGPEPDYPPATALHDLTADRENLEAAIRARAAELRAARS